MPRAEVAGDEKGSVSLKMAYLKGRIKDVPWDRYLPCYMKKNQSEIALTLYFKRELLWLCAAVAESFNGAGGGK